MADCSELCGKPIGEIAMLRHAMVKQFINQRRPDLNYAHNACNGNLTGITLGLRIRELLIYSGHFVISREKDCVASSLLK